MTTTATITGATRPAPSRTDRRSDVALRVELHRSVDWPIWSQYVSAHADATPFHHPTWLTAVELAFHHTAMHVVARRGERVAGVLPLFEVHSKLAGRLLSSVPYATYGGPLADDATTAAALARWAVQLAEERGARMLDLRCPHAVCDDLSVNERYVTFTRPLPAHPDEVTDWLPRKARAAVRNAIDRERLTVRYDAALLPTVWRLYSRSMRRLGSLNYPQRFFELLASPPFPRSLVSVVYAGDRPVAGLVSFLMGETMYPYFVGNDERVRSPGANNLLYASLMERAVEMGARRFDFGRSRRDNDGAIAFKRNQGFEPRPLQYQFYVPEGKSDPNLTPSNPRLASARRIWRRLPLAITRPLGSWLSASVTG